jgi:hypothetical protein
MARAQILILTAVQIEARHVSRALGMRPPGGGACTQGQFSDVDICLCLVGIRARRMPVLRPPFPDYIVLAGFAGALDPALRVGDVIVDGGLPGSELPSSCIRGGIHGVDHVAATPAEKRALFAATNAMAVDMESAIVRRWVAEASIPLVVIRAISDTAEQGISHRALNLVDEYGAASIAGVVKGLVSEPHVIFELIRLGRAARIAGKCLGRTVQQFVESYARSRGRTTSLSSGD